MIRSRCIADSKDHVLQKLRLDSQQDNIRISDHFLIIRSHTDSALRPDFFTRLRGQISARDLPGLNRSGCQDSANDSAGHISATDKTKSHFELHSGALQA